MKQQCEILLEFQRAATRDGAVHGLIAAISELHSETP